MTENTFATGRCLCGKVKYSIRSEPVRMAQCHCEDCRRASGTGHMSLAFFQRDDVNIEGETHEYASTADSGNINTRSFCPECGSRLFGRNSARPAMIAIAVGSADDSSWFKPNAVVYAKCQPVWDLVDKEIPAFSEMPPIPPPK